jgi:hypothetical protein
MKLKLLCLCLLGLVSFKASAQVACQTASRGFVFRADSLSSGFASQQVIASCQRHPSTSNLECERNVVCANTGGGWGGGGGHGGGGYYPPPRPPRPPEPPRPPRPPRPSAEQCYLHRYPDICINSPKNYCKDPMKHYLDHGQQEGRIWGCR